VFSELMATRAVIAGRRTYEHADRWQGDHHDGVPVFVLTRDVPDDPPPGSVRYVTDARECAAQARAAAGHGDVMVHGAGAAQALLRAGQLDELELHVVPVLLGQGRRLFDNLPTEHIELNLVRRLATSEVEELARHAPALPRPLPVTRGVARRGRRSSSPQKMKRQHRAVGRRGPQPAQRRVERYGELPRQAHGPSTSTACRMSQPHPGFQDTRADLLEADDARRRAIGPDHAADLACRSSPRTT
jgi:dihydrofolate reductase